MTSKNIDTQTGEKVTESVPTACTMPLPAASAPLVASVAAGTPIHTPEIENTAAAAAKVGEALNAAGEEFARDPDHLLPSRVLRARTSTAGEIRVSRVQGIGSPGADYPMALMMVTDRCEVLKNWQRGDILMMVRPESAEADTAELLRQIDTGEFTRWQNILAEDDGEYAGAFVVALVARINSADGTADRGQTPTILDLIRESTASGMTFDRADVGKGGFSGLLEDDLPKYIKTGKVEDLYGVKEVSDMLLPTSGGTPAGIVSEYFEWRATRRQFCKLLRQFITDVEADDARRDDLEDAILPPLSMEAQGTRSRAEADVILGDMEALLKRVATNSDRALGIGEAISAQFSQCERLIPLQPCVQGFEGAQAFAAAIFGPERIPNAQDEDGGAAQWAFTLAAIFLETIQRFDNADCLLEAAAIVTHRLNREAQEPAAAS